MAADVSTAAALLIVAHVNKPSFLEEVGNYVQTSQGKDQAGKQNVAKYVNMSPTFNVPLYGAAFVALGVTTPVDLEKVGNIALLHT